MQTLSELSAGKQAPLKRAGKHANTIRVKRRETDRRRKGRENMQPCISIKARENGQESGKTCKHVSRLSVSKHTTSEKRGKICSHVQTSRVGKLTTG